MNGDLRNAILLLLLGLWFLYFPVRFLWTGHASLPGTTSRPTNPKSLGWGPTYPESPMVSETYARATNPVGFWTAVLFFLAVATLFIAIGMDFLMDAI